MYAYGLNFDAFCFNLAGFNLIHYAYVTDTT